MPAEITITAKMIVINILQIFLIIMVTPFKTAYYLAPASPEPSSPLGIGSSSSCGGSIANGITLAELPAVTGEPSGFIVSLSPVKVMRN